MDWTLNEDVRKPTAQEDIATGAVACANKKSKKDKMWRTAKAQAKIKSLLFTLLLPKAKPDADLNPRISFHASTPELPGTVLLVSDGPV